MGELCLFRFKSVINLDEEQIIKFEQKGYKQHLEECLILYFKHEQEYKFKIINNEIEVNVGESKYHFVANKKTEALIKIDSYFYKTSVYTNRLLISDNLIEIDYEMDFVSFKGKYQIILELL